MKLAKLIPAKSRCAWHLFCAAQHFIKLLHIHLEKGFVLNSFHSFQCIWLICYHLPNLLWQSRDRGYNSSQSAIAPILLVLNKVW